MGLYVYAIGLADTAALPVIEGILSRPVYPLRSGLLAGIVSDCPLDVVRAERKHIAAAQRVMNTLNAQFDVLPTAFGTVSESEEVLRRFVDEYREALAAQLERIAGRFEMSVRLAFDVPDPIGFLVASVPELKVARDRVFNRRRPPSYDERIRLGQLCEATLQRYRDSQTAQLAAMLGSCCAEIESLPIHRDTEIAHLAMLVPRVGVDRFEGAVNDAAAMLPEDLALTLGGPWPPYNFVHLNL